MKRLLATFGAAMLLVGCTGSENSLAPDTVESVDLKRYQGTWYEQARLPIFFQRNCSQSEAHYRLKPDGSMAVLNRCRTIEGEWKEAKGTAMPQVAGKTNKLWVEFDNWVSLVLPGVTKGDYWVLHLGDSYNTALVGNPYRRYLWLLSRRPQIDQQTREELLSQAQQKGYDTTRLIWRTPDADMPKGTR